MRDMEGKVEARGATEYDVKIKMLELAEKYATQELHPVTVEGILTNMNKIYTKLTEIVKLQ